MLYVAYVLGANLVVGILDWRPDKSVLLRRWKVWYWFLPEAFSPIEENKKKKLRKVVMIF